MPSKTTSPTVTSKPTNALAQATEQLGELFATSAQAIYVYQDDHSKTCNARFAKLLGYANPEAWAAIHASFPAAFVAPKSQAALVEAFQAAMDEGRASNVPITWKRKDGKTVDTEVILVPIDVDGARLALHFITS